MISVNVNYEPDAWMQDDIGNTIAPYDYKATMDVTDTKHKNLKINITDNVFSVYDVMNFCSNVIDGMKGMTKVNNWNYIPQIKKVEFHNPATIVWWVDNTKTVVKCGEYDKFNPEFGLAMAISKKALGNTYDYYETFKQWIPQKYWDECEKEMLINFFQNQINNLTEAKEN